MHRLCVPTVLLSLAALPLSSCHQVDTRAADEETIRNLDAQWFRDCNAKDADKLVSSFYSDNALWMDENNPTRSGRAEILKTFKRNLAGRPVTLEGSATVVEISKSGDLAYLLGINKATYTDWKTKKLVSVKGKYVVVFKRQSDGSWKAVADMGNSDGPAEPVNK